MLESFQGSHHIQQLSLDTAITIQDTSTTSELEAQDPNAGDVVETSNPAQIYTGESQSEPLSGLETGAVFAGVVLISFLTITHLARQFSRWVFWKNLRERIAYTKKAADAPCSNCRFFNQNPYLRCTVHPYRALTSEAVDCSDYWSKESDRFCR